MMFRQRFVGGLDGLAPGPYIAVPLSLACIQFAGNRYSCVPLNTFRGGYWHMARLRNLASPLTSNKTCAFRVVKSISFLLRDRTLGYLFLTPALLVVIGLVPIPS